MASVGERICECHGEPMQVIHRSSGKVEWRCKTKSRASRKRSHAKSPLYAKETSRYFSFADDFSRLDEHGRLPMKGFLD